VTIPSPVRCVLFDAVGTLIFADPPVSIVYGAAAREFGVTIDTADIEQRFARAFEEHNSVDDGDGHLTSEARERDRWRAIVANVFPEVASTEALFQRLWEHFARPTSWRLYDDAADCWRRLSQRGLQLGIASNFDERLLSISRGLPPLDRCEHVVFSSQLGYRKPATRFFRAIERELGLTPHELLLVGDDWDNDYRAAQAAGWQAIYLDREASQSHAASIGSLAELF
jgi:putative hydrolase of the HAD superfamily